jgi:hypothetical protein
MTKTTLTAALAATLLAGQALAADTPRNETFRIESEDQFVRDYGDQVEQMGPGVYQVVKGPLAGKTVTLGEAGLAYDLAALRAQTPRSRQERMQLKTQIRRLENVRTRYAQLQALQARESGARKSASGVLPCYYRSGSTTIRYNAYVQLTATTEFYLDNGGGGLNYYYARAIATASGYTPRPHPFAFPFLGFYAKAENLISGQVEQRSAGSSNGGVSTGYVYSGPDFGHRMTAVATVTGGGDCFGYASLSDSLGL